MPKVTRKAHKANEIPRKRAKRAATPTIQFQITRELKRQLYARARMMGQTVAEACLHIFQHYMDSVTPTSERLRLPKGSPRVALQVSREFQRRFNARRKLERRTAREFCLTAIRHYLEGKRENDETLSAG